MERETTRERRKRLLFVVEAMGGGVFTYSVNLTSRLVENYELYLAYAVRPQTPEDYRDYFDPRIQMIEVKHFVRPICLKKDAQALLELLKIYQNIHPDIIHLHSSKAGVLGRLAYWNVRIPLFYTPHGYSFLMRQAGPYRRLFYRGLELLMARVRCTTISCSVGEHLETQKLTRRARLVNNGIDLREIGSYLDGCQVNRRNQPFTVFTLGRICPQKNPALFNQIAHALPEVRFLWIGDGEQRALLDAPNIRVTGWIHRAQALQQASQADCFLLVSLWEGLPLSLLEAMYLHKPCVVSDVIGNRDVICNDDNGFVCSTLDDYVRALRSAQDPAITAPICARAYQEILDEYNVETMARRYEEIYEEACQAVRPAANARMTAVAGEHR